MASPNLNTLPADILLLISQYLDLTALQSLCLVDKQSHAAACNSLYHSVKLNTSSLQADIDRWSSILRRNSALGTVRHLRVDGGDEEIKHRLAFQQSGEGGLGTDFAPLMDFLDTLPSLSRLTWACAPQLPELVLHFLHRKLPSCQLHLDSFRLYSIFDASVMQYEQRLVSSPNLYAIRCRLEQHTHHHILLHVLGLAPNLRILDSGTGTSCVVYPRKVAQIPEDTPWLQGSGVKGHLERLQYRASLDERTISSWISAMNPSRLRRLDLGGEWGDSFDPDVFRRLRQCDFHSLDDLSMHISIFDQDNMLCAAASGFIRNLRPLSALKITGNVDGGLFDSAIEAHGPRLRILKILPAIGGFYGRVYLNQITFPTSNLEKIVSHSPYLEAITIHVPRMLGNPDEVSMYRVLGAVPRLQTIKLKLDASDSAFYNFDYLDDDIPTEPSFTDLDNEYLDGFDGPAPRKGHVRKAFVNSAVDETLALSIFELIESAKPPGALSLETLQLDVKAGGSFGEGVSVGSIPHICDTLAQSWHLQRNERDDRRDEIIATRVSDKLGPDEEFNPKDYGAYRPNHDFDAEVRDDWDTIGPIFRLLWPSSREVQDGSSGWKEDWKSMPLEQ